jgi:hypothetical protein
MFQGSTAGTIGWVAACGLSSVSAIHPAEPGTSLASGAYEWRSVNGQRCQQSDFRGTAAHGHVTAKGFIPIWTYEGKGWSHKSKKFEF